MVVDSVVIKNTKPMDCCCGKPPSRVAVQINTIRTRLRSVTPFKCD